MLQEKSTTTFCAVIFTVLSDEYNAVKSYLSDYTEEVHSEGNVYGSGKFYDSNNYWKIGIVQVEKGNSSAAGDVERAINHFKPQVVLFVGVAGGVKDVKLGDVVASSKVYCYESGKDTGEFKVRPELTLPSFRIIHRAKAEANKQDWLKRIKESSLDKSRQPHALYGPIASGEKVVVSSKSKTAEFLEKHYNDTIAIDMEGYGFLKAMESHRTLESLVIRGISDLLNNKEESDKAGYQKIAAQNASAFAFEILIKLNGQKKSPPDRKQGSQERRIIDAFSEEIDKKKTKAAEDRKTIINFRDDEAVKRQREIWYVPIGLLRFRKNNGRISSEVMSYEKQYGELYEDADEAQFIIRTFLEQENPDKTEELRKLIKSSRQKEPAIITCDGFLINGNRRKLVFEQLSKEFPEESKYQFMEVVILPGKNDEGGPPTIKEIEQVENRYQFQGQGKSDYSRFNKAISFRRKMQLGIPLEELVSGDPEFMDLSSKERTKKLKEYKEKLLGPLECVDEYLIYLGREGLYKSISTGSRDKEGRWEAFIDYYNNIYKKLRNEKQRVQLKISEEERGIVQDAAFKIIRQRDFPNLKVHMIMRELPKWLKYHDLKSELFKLKNIEMGLDSNETQTQDINLPDDKGEDRIWKNKYGSQIISQVVKVKRSYEHKSDRETPLTLLEGALKKLNHEYMDPGAVNISDLEKGMKLAAKVKERANDLESEFYHLRKDLKKLERPHQ